VNEGWVGAHLFPVLLGHAPARELVERQAADVEHVQGREGADVAGVARHVHIHTGGLRRAVDIEDKGDAARRGVDGVRVIGTPHIAGSRPVKACVGALDAYESRACA
jgi:hypothetical protein